MRLEKGSSTSMTGQIGSIRMTNTSTSTSMTMTMITLITDMLMGQRITRQETRRRP